MVSSATKNRNPEDKRPVMLFAQDESRFGRITSTGKSWAPHRIRPVAKQQIVREYTYAYMAVCPQTGESSSLILPVVNADAMQIFLDKTSNDFPDYFIVMQVDGASWHKSKKLTIPENIRFIYQPPYSPEVNPTENVWDYVKENDFKNKCFSFMQKVEDQLCRSLEKLRKAPELLKSIIACSHLNNLCLNAN